MLLRLWCRWAAAALIWPLAWELPCAAGAALKKKKKEKIFMHRRKCIHKKETWIFLVVQWVRIQCCHCCGSGSIPLPGTSTCYRWHFLLPKVIAVNNFSAILSGKEKEYSWIYTEIPVFKVHIYVFFFCVLLGPHPWHMEVPRLGVELEL